MRLFVRMLVCVWSVYPRTGMIVLESLWEVVSTQYQVEGGGPTVHR